MNRATLIPVVMALLIAPTAGAQNQSITLDEAVARAMETLPSMVQARGAIENAHATQLQTWGSWLPNVSASAGNSVNSSTRFDQQTQRTVSGSSSSYSTSLSANMTLFDGFSRLADHRIADAELELAKQLVDQITSEKFEPEKYHDEVREKMEGMIQDKVEGKEISALPTEEPKAQIVDLMQALKASLGSGGATAEQEGEAKKAS